jgi:hypothetical protein
MMDRTKNNRKGGPRTAVGKAVASRNSTKIGVYGLQVVLPGENPEEFDDLLGLFVEDFQPSGVTEAALVHELAVLTWKKRRLEGLEHRQLFEFLHAAPSEYEFSLVGLSMVKGMESFIFDPYRVDDCDVPAFREYYAQTTNLRRGTKDEAALTALQTDYPQTFSRLASLMKQMGLETLTPAAMAAVKYKKDGADESKSPLGDAINLIYEEARKIVWAADNRDAIIEAHDRIRDARLAKKIDKQPYERAYEYLARNFYKVLSELRKQQEWRRKLLVIDVTPLDKEGNR